MRRTRKILGCLSLACSFSCFFAMAAVPADAQAQTDPSLAEARARFAEGLDLADKGDNENARLKFGQAWSLMKSASVLYNLARSEMLTGHNLEALEHFQLFVKMNTDPKVTEIQRKRANESIDKLSSLVGRISVEAPPRSRITVDSKPAFDFVKGSIAVAPGTHVVEAIYDGRVKSVTVNAQPGTITTAKIAFENDEGAPSSLAAADAARAEQPSSSRFWSTGRIAGASIAGAGLVALGFGVGFGLASQSSKQKGDDIQNQFPEAARTSACNPSSGTPTDPRCSELASVRSDQDTQAGLSLGFYIGGAAALVGGAVLFLVSGPPKSEPSRAVNVVPVVTAREGGLSVVGRF